MSGCSKLFPSENKKAGCVTRSAPGTYLIDNREEFAPGLRVDALLDTAIAGHQVVHLRLALLGAAAVALKTTKK